MIETADAWRTVGFFGPAIVLTALTATAGAIMLLFPVFRRFALAVPTARSSHQGLTPQWGGLPVIVVTLALAALVTFLDPSFSGEIERQLYLVLAGVLLLLGLGVADDIHSLTAGTKLIVQVFAIGLVIAGLPNSLRLLPMAPLWMERSLIFLGLLWSVNLTNFMDGIDWIMVAEVVPVTGGVALIAALGNLPPQGVVVASALGGALLGFAPFNRPVAHLFLGDMGSMPIGLLIGWLLLLVAGAGYSVAAVLLPLYFLSDASVTLLRRIWRRERVWEGHRTHFYQRASDNGFSNMQIVARIFAVNLVLVGLAALTVAIESPAISMAALVAGVTVVTALLISFAQPRVGARLAKSNRGPGDVL